MSTSGFRGRSDSPYPNRSNTYTLKPAPVKTGTRSQDGLRACRLRSERHARVTSSLAGRTGVRPVSPRAIRLAAWKPADGRSWHFQRRRDRSRRSSGPQPNANGPLRTGERPCGTVGKGLARPAGPRASRPRHRGARKTCGTLPESGREHGLFPDEPGAHGLSTVPGAEPVRLNRGHPGGLQVRDRGPAEARRDALERRRRQRLHRAAVFRSQKQVRRLLGTKGRLISQGLHKFVVHPFA